MKLEKLQNILIGLGGSLLLLFLVGKTQSIEFTEHEQYHENLINLKESYAILNQDLLKARYEIATSYDNFVRELSELKQTQSAMKKIPTFIEAEGVSEIKELLAKNAATPESVKSLSESLDRKSVV